MTYNVFDGTLNLAQSINQSADSTIFKLCENTVHESAAVKYFKLHGRVCSVFRPQSTLA